MHLQTYLRLDSHLLFAGWPAVRIVFGEKATPDGHSSSGHSLSTSVVSAFEAASEEEAMSSKVQDAPAPEETGDGSPPISCRGNNMDSAAVQASINPSTLRYSYPLGPETGGEHSYSPIGTSGFQVRGPNYLEDRVKVDAGPTMFDLMHTEMFRCNDKIGNVAARRESWLRAARAAGDTRYYFVVLYVTPAAPYIHFVFYFAVQPERVRAAPHFASLWKQFTAHGPEADDFRNERWKVIPRVTEAPWAVSYAVGSKPALLAQKLTHTWILNDDYEPPKPAPVGVVEVGQDSTCGTGSIGYRSRGGSFASRDGPGPYLEADCDVASSSMAFMLVSLLQSSAKYLVIDLCFCIEPREDATLPEAALGAIRLSRMEVGRPALVDALPGDWVLGARGQVYAVDDTTGEEGS